MKVCSGSACSRWPIRTPSTRRCWSPEPDDRPACTVARSGASTQCLGDPAGAQRARRIEAKVQNLLALDYRRPAAAHRDRDGCTDDTLERAARAGGTQVIVRPLPDRAARLRRSMRVSSGHGEIVVSPTPASCSTAARWRVSSATSRKPMSAAYRARTTWKARFRGAVRPHGTLRAPGRGAAAFDRRSERLFYGMRRALCRPVPARDGPGFSLRAGHRALRESAVCEPAARGAMTATRASGRSSRARPVPSCAD